MSGALVTIRNLRVSYGPTVALEGINADLHPGRMTALIGPNGSGKSTLLKALLGLVPYSGEISLSVPRRMVGYVPQRVDVDRGLPATVRGFAGVLLGSRPLPFGLGASLRKRIGDLLARTGADHLLDKPLGGLSGGEMQRVLLALALEPMPKLLLLDEPAAGLDTGSEARMYEILRELVGAGVGVVMVSHDLSVVSDLTDHVLCINRTLVCEGSARDVLTQGRIAEVFGHHHGVYRHEHGEHDHAH